MAQQNRRAIGGFMMAAENLQCLEISFMSSLEYHHLMARKERCVIKLPFAEKRVWPQLKHLTLSNLATSINDLVSLLEFHRETLQTIQLGNISL